ncbi:MAG TPA: hypothetical protein VF162_14975, partial [Streptosporangiaceae bacterium]
DRYLLGVLRHQTLAELIDGIQAPGSGRRRTDHPGTDAEQESGTHAERLPQKSLRVRKDCLNARDHLRNESQTSTLILPDKVPDQARN